MNLKLTLVALFCVACLESIQCQKAERYTAQNSCTSKTTCSECMQTKSCQWCFQRQFDGPRCYDPARTADGRGGCPEEFTMNVDNLVTPVDAFGAVGGAIVGESGINTGQGIAEAGSAAARRNFGFVGENAQESASFLTQRVKLDLRMNTAAKLNFVYSQAEDYPVDLYYIMDLSKSMENDKAKLSALGDLLASTMRKTTSNFRLGFGSFVDKVVMPYVSTVPKNLKEPCTGCAAPYGFMNDMALSTDTHKFSEAVRDARVSGNLDAPEGGFDAIMQAVVCRNEIGWRDNARRLLVFSTDAGFHYAGDGKLGGIVQPNDGQCHLDETGLYSYSKIQDYPSISQINLKVQQNAINLIFAVTADQYGVYEQLRQRIEGASCGVLSNHSENVVQFIEEQYNKITSAVEIKDNSSSAVQIKYFSSCLGGGPPIETNKCNGLKVGDKVQFTAEILVTECPKNRDEWKQLIRIYPVAVGEQLLIDLQMLCECDCERPGNANFEANSNVCHFHGDMACGVCRCHEPYFGRHCECPTDHGHMTDMHSLVGCRPGNLTTGPECSGRGTCICGECHCTNTGDESQEISGPFCDCDNFSCDRHKGVLCSGPEHGVCGCKGCACKPGWTGPACDCAVSEDTCRVAPDEPVCSGHGQCKCGVCVCDVTDDGHYSGRYCEQCPTCPGRCQEFRDCVRCQVYQDGPLAESGECAANCTAFVPYTVDKVIKNETLDESLCSYSNEEDCWYSYVYSFDENNRPIVRAQKEPDCPPQVFILGIVLGVIAAIVLVGLALLMLWKMVTTIHDRREFARFEKERMMAKWDTGENPIYKQATSTFKNPTYAGK